MLAFDMHMDSCSFGNCGRQLQSTQIMRISGRELGAGRGRRVQLDGGGHERKEECGGKRACPTLAHACHTLPAHNTDCYIQRMILLNGLELMLIADAAEVVEVAAAAAVPRALQRSQSNQNRVLCLKQKMGCKIRERVNLLRRVTESSSSSSCFSRWGEVY